MRLLYFHAKWCVHCKELDTKFMKKTKAIGNIKVERLDCDNNGDWQFFSRLRVSSIPALVLVDESNTMLWKHSGSDITLEQIEEKIQKFKQAKL